MSPAILMIVAALLALVLAWLAARSIAGKFRPVDRDKLVEFWRDVGGQG